MATSQRNSQQVRAAKSTLLWFGIILIVLGGLNFIAVSLQNGLWTPKLALDLQGGTQVVLAARLQEGQSPSADQMNQAAAIIRQRVDAAGISESEVTTQGGTNIVVSVPGEMDAATQQRIESSAKLEFRPVLFADSAANTQVVTPQDFGMETFNATPTAEPTDPSDTVQLTDQLYADFLGFNCLDVVNNPKVADPTKPIVACDSTLTEKFVLGPVEISGEHITDASSGVVTNQQGVATGQWAVNLQFDGEGTQQFRDVTTRLVGIGATPNPETGQPDTNRSRFAVTLDGIVIVAPTANAVITDGRAQITGSFTQQSSQDLANQLKFGALPFSFDTQSTQTISATLGTSQLRIGLIAGLIGLLIVAVYSLVQYRVLGLVTLACLVLLTVVSYLVVTLLSNQQGYRLSLAGVAGLIVSVGITADSFIVYFERIKDELREGRSLPAAVERGWTRAIRTVLAADGVSLLVALVLYFVAVGSVRGFAITLGITTLINLLVVTMFTHPVMRLLATTRFFGSGHPASGLDPNALGAVYRGRGEFRRVATTARSKGSAHEAQRRQSIAERKAAAAKEEQH